MEWRRGRARGGWVSKMAPFCYICVLLLSVFVLVGNNGAWRHVLDNHHRRFTGRTQDKIAPATATMAVGRRKLGGPGSYPPRCASKCGRCTPCRPVHVTVPPGTPVITEYYPEAWRCKCGNKYYMP